MFLPADTLCRELPPSASKRKHPGGCFDSRSPGKPGSHSLSMTGDEAFALRRLAMAFPRRFYFFQRPLASSKKICKIWNAPAFLSKLAQNIDFDIREIKTCVQS